MMTSGPWGHTASSVVNPSRVVLYCEPLFYNFSRQTRTWNPEGVRIAGWHKRIMSDNVVHVDGSARCTRVGKLSEFDQETLARMNYTPDYPPSWYLRRGRTWQLDCYPSPGALIRRFSPSGVCMTNRPGDLGYRGWPFDNYQYNLRPE